MEVLQGNGFAHIPDGLLDGLEPAGQVREQVVGAEELQIAACLAEQPDGLTSKQITGAIDAELAAKGMTKTEADTADLYIGYQTAIGQEKEFTSYDTGWGYGAGWGRGWYGGGGMSTTYGSTSTVYIGQLDLSIYDPAQKQLVWRGVASKTLDPKAKPEKKQKNITKAVQKLLKNFPPQPKK